MREILRLAFRRITIFPVALVLSMIILFFWEVMSPNYLVVAKWITSYILIPMHRLLVKAVAWMAPTFEQLAKNKEPSHHNADRIISILLHTFFTIVLTIVWVFVKSIVDRIRGFREPEIIPPTEVIRPRAHETLKERLNREAR